MAIQRGIRELCAEAEASIETWSAEQAIAALRDPAAQLVDIRDVRELWREGAVPGALHAPRGMLEFWVDPASPYAKPVFQSGKRFVFFCAGGLRSALATRTLQEMGLAPVCHVRGGFAAWRQAGGPIVSVEPPPREREGAPSGRSEETTMAFRVRRADYYHVRVDDLPERGARLLSDLAESGVNMLAFSAVPSGARTELTILAEDDAKLVAAARRAGLALDGPHPALLVQGDDELGALARIHARLADADVAVAASTGVTDGRGAFGYVVYVRPADIAKAEAALGL